MADVLALHGFTLRGRMWGEVADLAGGAWLTPDLPGHGEEPVVGWEDAVARIVAMTERSGPGTVLVGYSMGGRLALAAALAGARPLGLVLVSASPGIEDPQARARRRASDERLADRLERIGVEAFLDEWLSGEMFAGLGRRPSWWGRADRRLRATNAASGLAGALRRLGQGVQPYLGDRIGDLACPVFTLAGASDERYARLAERMAAGAPRGESRTVPNAGHAVVAEAPRAVAEVVRSAAST